MHQAHEIPHVALDRGRRTAKSVRDLLRCGTLLAVLTCMAGCTGNDRNNADGDGSRVNGGKTNAIRILSRGLPGEPRTLDPQLAEDTFSFPVLRDLYEGLTAEDRKGQIVPGAAESWTIDKTGTVYTFV